ncbi:MAG: PAS domain-containing protein [Desulfuromonadaceae bacterium]|nr:PAS domain-containing protein [Desulfuromonadaceae bacterium]
MNRTIQELTWEHDAIIDSSSDGLFVCDGKGRILRVNPASAISSRKMMPPSCPCSANRSSASRKHRSVP